MTQLVPDLFDLLSWFAPWLALLTCYLLQHLIPACFTDFASVICSCVFSNTSPLACLRSCNLHLLPGSTVFDPQPASTVAPCAHLAKCYRGLPETAAQQCFLYSPVFFRHPPALLSWIHLATCASLGTTPSVPNLRGVLHLAARGALSAFRPPTRYVTPALLDHGTGKCPIIKSQQLHYL